MKELVEQTNIAIEALRARYKEHLSERTNWFYLELIQLLESYKAGIEPFKCTEIGAGAIKTFDSGLPEDDALTHALCKLDRMHNRFIINAQHGLKTDLKALLEQ